MRKNLYVVIIIILALAASILTACGVVIMDDDIFGEYVFTNPPDKETVYDVDEGVVLDGKADEAFWQTEHNWYVGNFSDGSLGNVEIMHGQLNPCELRVTSHFTDKGVYFMAEMDDDVINVYRVPELAAHQKTGLSFYVAAPGQVKIDEGNGAYEFVLAVDGTSLLNRRYRGGYNRYPLEGIGWATSYVNADFDEHGNGTADGYVMEVFIPWNMIKLDGKPEYLNVAFAGVRHQNATEESQFTWEWNPQGTAKWGEADTWLKFTESGLYAADPQDKTIDGDDADWADYTGEVKRVYYTQENDPRYLEYKMTRGSDGLYVYAEAVQNLFMTDNAGWWLNTNIEVVVTNKQGGGVSYALDGAGWKADYTEGIMKAVDTQIGGKAYKLITAEYFIPDFALSFGASATSGDDIDTTQDVLRVGIAFRNGTGNRLENGEFDPATNEVTKAATATDAHVASQPYLIFPFKASPWDAGQRLYVTENGIGVGAQGKDKTIDGDASDWADYRGATISSYGADDDANKGFAVKAVKGSDGLYFYAEIRHANEWVTGGSNFNAVTGLRLQFSITDTQYAGNGDNGKLGWTPNFLAIGCSDGAYCAQHMRRSDSQDANGLYTTVIEGFVPFSQMGDFSNLKDSTGAPVFDRTTGTLADGYVLRVGFAWESIDETIYVSGWGERAEWLVAQHSLGQAQGNFIVDENGLHRTRNAPASMYIDGDDSDWAAYEGTAFKATAADGERYAETKAVMREDGLYTITTARIKNFISGNAVTSGWSGVDVASGKTNSALEIRYITASGANELLALITPAGATFATSWIPQIDYTFTVIQNGDYYDVVIEAFIENAYLAAKTGSANPEDLQLSFAFYVPDDDDVRVLAPDGYDTATSVSGDNGLYYVTVLGLTKESSMLDRTAIYASAVTDNIRDGVLKPSDALEVTVTVNDVPLIENKDYTLTVSLTAGGGTYTVEGIGSYIGKIVRTFSSGLISLDDVEIIVPDTVEFGESVSVSVIYNGEAVSIDYYEISGGSTDALGEKTITVTGKGMLYGSKDITFTVVRKDISDGLSVEITTILVNGTPTEKVELGSTTLVKDVDYTIEFGDVTTAGNKTAILTGAGNYTGTFEVTYVVLAEPVNMSNVTAAAEAYDYYEPNADSFLPENLVVKYGDTILTENTDYTIGAVEYDNTDGGQATLTINGQGLFTGTTTVNYTIHLYRYFTDTSKFAVELSDSEALTYTGKKIEPSVTVRWNGAELIAGTDYAVVYEDNIDAGEATIRVSARSDQYKGSAEKKFTIQPKNLSSVDVEVPDDLKHSGRAVTPDATVTLDGLELTKDTDFTLSYSGDTANLKSDKNEDGTYKFNYGEATLIVTGTGNYTGSTEITYRFTSEAVAKRIDGDDVDWADYNGNKSIILADNGAKGVEIMAKWESDGVYVFAVARHGKLLKNSGNVLNDTHLHVALAIGDGTTFVSGGQYSVTPTGVYNYWSSGYAGVHEGAASAFVTTGEEGSYVTYIELFIPQRRFRYDLSEKFFSGNALLDTAAMRIGFSWKTQGETAVTYDLGYNDDKTAVEEWMPLNRWTDAFGINLRNVANFYYLDSNTATINRGLREQQHVTQHFAIDGDATDWADYNGNTAVIFNKLNTKGVDIMAKWESDGVYVFAVARHANLTALSGNPANDTALWISLGVRSADGNFASGGGHYITASGHYTYYADAYSGRYPGIESAFRVTGEAGGYVTYIETFIPNSCFNNNAHFTSGTINDDSDLRIMFAWRSVDESEQIFGKNTGTIWGPMNRWANGFGSDNVNTATFYYLDKNTSSVNRGLRYSEYVAQDRAIDGDVSDWSDYNAANLTVARTEGSDGRYIEYRAYYGTDGTYLSIRALIDKVVIGNIGSTETPVNFWKIWKYQTHCELVLGGKTLGFAYGYNTMHDSNNFDCLEHAMSYTEQNGQYLVDIEIFIPKEAYNELGFTLNDQGNPELGGWVFGCQQAEGYLLTEYEEFKTVDGNAASTQTDKYQWFGGNYTKDTFTVAEYTPAV